MLLAQLRQADLNLLVVFAVLAEERSITAAANRLLLSQPATSRALQRLRVMFGDDLLVRGAGGYDLTPQGQKVLKELETLLPRLGRLMTGSEFDPAGESTTFRIAGPDNVCSVLAPVLCRRFVGDEYKIAFEFIPWHTEALDLLARGRLDLVLHIDDGLMPAGLTTEKLYREDWACVVAKENPLNGRISLEEYAAASHLTVCTLAGVQSLPDKHLAALRVKRRSTIRMPYFGAAIRCIPHTNLVLTVTSGMAQAAALDPELKVLEAPRELLPFHFLMVWHNRLRTDAAHSWLRNALRSAATEIQTSK
jgi:DNA-binding transcriptional LysR family regulator